MSLSISEQYEKIYRYCYFKVHNCCLAEDLTQETFLRYFAQNSYIHRGKQLAYLYTIARNLCIDYYRRQKTEEFKEEMVSGSYFVNGKQQNNTKITANPMEKVEESLSLQMAVEKLPKEMQEVILLRYVNELSVKEICEITGLSRSSEYRMEKEALQRLKKWL
ncbi:MAG: RNA polymerase sigma factor [Lachnospiraceae bacterium]